MERAILGVSVKDRIRNEVITEQTGQRITVTDISSQNKQAEVAMGQPRLSKDRWPLEQTSPRVETARRFGEESICQESVEICCTIPPDPEQKKPQPDPSKVKGCGYRNPNGIGASFIGADTQFGEFPWVIALIDSKNNSYVGVGVLINPEVVMTRAHVVWRYAPYTIRARAGEWDTQTEKEIFPFEEREVKEIVLHNSFNKNILYNDIALLRLDSPLVLKEHINRICLPEQNENFESHKNCVANGWGKDRFGLTGRYAVILKKVEVDIWSPTDVATVYYRRQVSFAQGGRRGRILTCQGDGGAPLACPIGNDRYKLTALVVWGIGCGQKDVPAVYTNVPKFRYWVDKQMAEWSLIVTSYESVE